jgi:hypothetical protein
MNAFRKRIGFVLAMTLAAALTLAGAEAYAAQLKGCEVNEDCNERHPNWPNCAQFLCGTGNPACNFIYECNQ